VELDAGSEHHYSFEPEPVWNSITLRTTSSTGELRYFALVLVNPPCLVTNAWHN